MGVAGSVTIEQRIQAPADSVAGYLGDFRNAREWMVGVESVEPLGEDSYRLRLQSPIGRIEPEVRMLEHGPRTIRWSYTSVVEGGGEVEVAPEDGGSSCTVFYSGKFELERRLLGRVAKAAGMEHFARRNGERSLMRLKSLMEARRYA